MNCINNTIYTWLYSINNYIIDTYFTSKNKLNMKVLTTLKSKLRFPKSKRWKLLKKACFSMAKHSNSLANQSLYHIKQHYKETWDFIKFWELDRLIKNDTSPDNFNLPYNRHYRWMMANSAQWTIKAVYNEYKWIQMNTNHTLHYLKRS